MSHKNIIVIGGGLGGISAAIRLAQSGFNVTLYEQNDHIGGK
ncbi:FAD-dependent oxidoreductase, partial [Staphylococcus borealis]